ncbi:hypothetical protein BGC31_15175 [Komagataeibacter xylinus]|nr:hypothetical protein BGC31_15175 [Komagataeibacter xylinus]RFP06469.1 hypothetical protein BFX83_11925 [Komagataeibacter xylinus]
MPHHVTHIDNIAGVMMGNNPEGQIGGYIVWQNWHEVGVVPPNRRLAITDTDACPQGCQQSDIVAAVEGRALAKGRQFGETTQMGGRRD